MKRCAILGDSYLYDEALIVKIKDTIENLLKTDKEFYFYVISEGVLGNGKFRSLCIETVKALKIEYPYKSIFLVSVSSYRTLDCDYDITILPNIKPDPVSYSIRIKHMMRWMINVADILL